jgi:hypothetical protein
MPCDFPRALRTSQVAGLVARPKLPLADADPMMCGKILDLILSAEHSDLGVQRLSESGGYDFWTDTTRIAQGHGYSHCRAIWSDLCVFSPTT